MQSTVQLRLWVLHWVSWENLVSPGMARGRGYPWDMGSRASITFGLHELVSSIFDLVSFSLDWVATLVSLGSLPEWGMVFLGCMRPFEKWDIFTGERPCHRHLILNPLLDVSRFVPVNFPLLPFFHTPFDPQSL